MCIRLPFPTFDRHYLSQRIAIIAGLELFSIPRNQFENQQNDMAEILLKVHKLPYNLHMNWTEAEHTILEFLGVDASQFCQYAMLSGREITEII